MTRQPANSSESSKHAAPPAMRAMARAAVAGGPSTTTSRSNVSRPSARSRGAPPTSHAGVSLSATRTTRSASLETALRLAEGVAFAEHVDIGSGDDVPRRLIFSEKFACPVSGFTISEIEPRLFSFNNPYGACPVCDGLGMKRRGGQIKERVNLGHRPIDAPAGAHFPPMEHKLLLGWSEATHNSKISVTTEIT